MSTSTPKFKVISLPSGHVNASKYVSIGSSISKTELSVFSKVISYCGNGEVWTIDRNGCIHIHKLPTYRLMKKMDGMGNIVSTIHAQITDNKLIHTCILPVSKDEFYMGTGAGKIELWNRRRKKSSKTLAGHSGAITSMVKFMSSVTNKLRIVSASTDFTIRYWEDNQVIAKLTDLAHWVNALCYCNGLVWAACESTSIRLYNEDGKLHKVFENCHEKGIVCLEYNYGGDEVWTVGKDRKICIFNATSLEQKESFTIPFDINVIFYAMDGSQSRMILGSLNLVHIWDCTSRMKVMEIPLKGHVFCIASIFSGGQVKASTTSASKKDIWMACSDRKIRVYSLDEINHVVRKAVNSNPQLREHFQSYSIGFAEKNEMEVGRDRTLELSFSDSKENRLEIPKALDIDESIILDENHRSVYTQTENDEVITVEVPKLNLVDITKPKVVKSSQRLINTDRPKSDSVMLSKPLSSRNASMPKPPKNTPTPSSALALKKEIYVSRKLEQNNKVLNERIDKQVEEIKQLKEFIAELTQKYNTTVQERDTSTHIAQVYREKLKDLESTISQVDDLNKSLVEEKENLNVELSTFKNDHKNQESYFEAQLSEKDEEISNLKKELQSFVQKNQSLMREAQVEKEKALKLELDLSFETEEHKKIVDELNQSQEEISLDNSTLRDRCDDLRKDVIRLKCEQESERKLARETIETLQLNLEKSKEAEAQHKMIIEKLEKEIDELKREIETLKEDLQSSEWKHNQVLDSFEQETSFLQERVRELSTLLDETQVAKDLEIKNREKVIKMEKQIEEYREASNDSKVRIEALNTELAELRAMYQSTTNSLLEKDQTISTLLQQINNLETSINTDKVKLENQILKILEENKNIRLELEEATKKNNNITSEYEQFKSDTHALLSENDTKIANLSESLKEIAEVNESQKEMHSIEIKAKQSLLDNYKEDIELMRNNISSLETQLKLSQGIVNELEITREADSQSIALLENTNEDCEKQINELMEQNANLSAQVCDLTAQLKRVGLQREELKKRLLELQSTIEDFNKNDGNTRQEIYDLNTLNKSLELELEHLRSNFEDRSNELSNLKSTYEETLEILQAKTEEFAICNGKKDQEIQELKSQISELHTANEDLQFQHLQLQENSLKLKHALDELTLTNEYLNKDSIAVQHAYKEQIDSLNESIEKLNTECSSKNSLITEYMNRISELEEEIALLRDESFNSNSNLNQQLIEKNNELSKLRSDLEGLESNFEAINSQLELTRTEKDDSIKNLNEEINKLKEEMNISIQQSTENTEALQKIIDDLTEKKESEKLEQSIIVEQKEEEIHQLKKVIQDLEERIQTQISNSENNLEELKNQYDTLSKENSEKIISLTAQIESLQADADSKVSIIDELNDKLKSQDEELQTISTQSNNEIANLNNQIKELENIKLQLESTHQKDIDDLQRKIDKLNEVLEVERKTLQISQSQSGELEKKLQIKIQELEVKNRERASKLDSICTTLHAQLGASKRIPEYNPKKSSPASFAKISENLQSMLQKVESDLT